jgi:hypothetical protein
MSFQRTLESSGSAELRIRVIISKTTFQAWLDSSLKLE